MSIPFHSAPPYTIPSHSISIPGQFPSPSHSIRIHSMTFHCATHSTGQCSALQCSASNIKAMHRPTAPPIHPPARLSCCCCCCHHHCLCCSMLLLISITCSITATRPPPCLPLLRSCSLGHDVTHPPHLATSIPIRLMTPPHFTPANLPNLLAPLPPPIRSLPPW